MNKRPSIKGFRERALQDSAVNAEYDALAPVCEMKRQMTAMRKAAGLTQAQMADLLGTKKRIISRLESVTTGNSAKLATAEEYARVPGDTVKVDFEPKPAL